jgi:hypothetical protein
VPEQILFVKFVRVDSVLYQSVLGYLDFKLILRHIVTINEFQYVRQLVLTFCVVVQGNREDVAFEERKYLFAYILCYDLRTFCRVMKLLNLPSK